MSESYKVCPHCEAKNLMRLERCFRCDKPLDPSRVIHVTPARPEIFAPAPEPKRAWGMGIILFFLGAVFIFGAAAALLELKKEWIAKGEVTQATVLEVRKITCRASRPSSDCYAHTIQYADALVGEKAAELQMHLEYGPGSQIPVIYVPGDDRVAHYDDMMQHMTGKAAGNQVPIPVVIGFLFGLALVIAAFYFLKPR